MGNRGGARSIKPSEGRLPSLRTSDCVGWACLLQLSALITVAPLFAQAFLGLYKNLSIEQPRFLKTNPEKLMTERRTRFEAQIECSLDRGACTKIRHMSKAVFLDGE